MRRAEFALHDAEALVARQPGKKDVLQQRLRELWRKLLICQFHDVAGGVGIRRTHEEAEQMLQQVVDGARDITRDLRHAYYHMEDHDQDYVIYNSCLLYTSRCV